MAHALPALQVVSGLVVAYIAFVFGSTVDSLDWFLITGLVFCGSLFVAVQGFFFGIEAAIAAATGQSDTGRTRE